MSSIQHKALRPIAVVEASKGVMVLLAGFGLLSFLGRNNEAFAAQLIHQLQPDPAKHYPHIFIAAMASLDDSTLWLLAGLAATYSCVRFIEAYGLWNERRWAEWLAALSGGIYLPIEIYEIIHHVTGIKLGVFVFNLAIVGYMVWLLAESRRSQTAQEKRLTAPTIP